MAGSGRGAVVAALVGNAALTLIKLGAFVVSGSGAMLSEAIHSLADTGNQGLLYTGVRRSERPPDELFPYGYGADRFLFALLSAVGIFILGCGVTVYHGIHTLLHPPQLELSWIVFAVLAVSFLVDGAVFVTTLRAIHATKGTRGFIEYIRTTSDPTVLAVLFEDFVASAGVVVAAIGIALAQVTGDPRFDAISSIIIGLMLGGIAIWLGWRNHMLILGPSIPAEVERGAIEYLAAQPSVEGVRDIKTRVLASDRFRLKAEIDYDGGVLAQPHVAWVRAQLARDDFDAERFTAEFGERMMHSLAAEIDRIEAALRERYPRLRHLDFEADERQPDEP